MSGETGVNDWRCSMYYERPAGRCGKPATYNGFCDEHNEVLAEDRQAKARQRALLDCAKALADWVAWCRMVGKTDGGYFERAADALCAYNSAGGKLDEETR